MANTIGPERKHVFLLGFMGSGKSTVGPLLAQLLGIPFLDLDEFIEATEEATIADIFERSGEPAFRTLETACLSRVAAPPPRVIALGGGTFVSSANQRIIRRSGISVWLDVPLELAIQRCSSPERPLAQDPEEFRRLFAERWPVYAEADLRVNVKEISPDQVAREIRDRLEEMTTWPG